MGYDLDAFLGQSSHLRTWKHLLPSAVVCELSGDIGMVPMTRKVCQELRERLGAEEIKRLEAAHAYPDQGPAIYKEAVRRWGLEASQDAAVAFVHVGAWGDHGWDEANLWSNGRELLTGVRLQAVLDHFQDQAKFGLGDKEIDLALERHGGEDAAERWAAAATLQRQP